MSLRPAAPELNAIIIHNKRFTHEDQLNLKTAADELTIPNQLNVKYIDYVDMDNFTQQLLMLRKADLHISGPGTASAYSGSS